MSTRTTLALTATALTALQAAAQTDEIDSETVDRIIVTGARAPIEISRIGSATTIITREDIERRQARYLTDVLRTLPGFAVSISGALGSQTQVRVRGGEANHVLVLVDGVRANDPATSDEFRWEHLATGNIERVEIVRGPQSALWGSDAIGAVVNVITRAARDDSNIDGYVESGANGTRNAGANAGTSFDDWRLSAAIEALDTDGTNSSRSGSEPDGAELATGSVGIRYDGSDRFAFGATVRASDATSAFDGVDDFTGLPADGDLETQSDTLLGNFGVSLAANDSRVGWQMRARYYDSEHRNFADRAENSSTASDRLTFGLQADIAFDTNALSLALEHEDTDFEQRGEIGFADPNQNRDMQVASAIAEYRHLAGERLTWIIGSRYDRHSDFENALTGRFSAAYQLSESTRLRAGIGTGQKTPTFTERFGSFPALFTGNPELKPESSLSYDVGLDREWLGGSVSLAVSLYRQALDDEIDGFVFDPDTFLFTAENREGESERSGIELAADWRVNDALRFGASYTYTDAKEQNDAGVSVAELRRPRHSGGITLAYGSRAERFDAILVAEYGGERDDQFFPPFPEPSQRLTLDDYWLVDVTAQYRLTPAVALFARVTNLLDENYEQVFGYATLGRSAYFGVRADLGR